MTLPERTVLPEVAENWIRECLSLDPGGITLTVSGTCMQPALREGSRISLKPPARSPRFGDVVLLRTAEGLRLHRVLFRFGDRIRTKGDQGTYLDPTATEDAVIAVCLMKESAFTRSLNAGRSVLRLFTRPWTASFRSPGRSDGAHARLLP